MELSVYEQVGGQPFFDQLVNRFYDGVAQDRLLRPLYPEDLIPSRKHLAQFLAQYWGGPPYYSAARGHPRLRMRHRPFVIGATERDAWMHHMRAALETADIPEPIRNTMMEYFESAATHLINKQPPEPPPDTPRLPVR